MRRAYYIDASLQCNQRGDILKILIEKQMKNTEQKNMLIENVHGPTIGQETFNKMQRMKWQIKRMTGMKRKL